MTRLVLPTSGDYFDPTSQELQCAAAAAWAAWLMAEAMPAYRELYADHPAEYQNTVGELQRGNHGVLNDLMAVGHEGMTRQVLSVLGQVGLDVFVVASEERDGQGDRQ